MNDLIDLMNEKKYKKVYDFLMTNYIDVNSFDFLYRCNTNTSIEFLNYCMLNDSNIMFKFIYCQFISYADIYLENQEEIIKTQINNILNEDSNFVYALEFVIYNYYANPSSPFNEEEILDFAKKLYSLNNDKLAKKIILNNKI